MNKAHTFCEKSLSPGVNGWLSAGWLQSGRLSAGVALCAALVVSAASATLTLAASPSSTATATAGAPSVSLSLHTMQTPSASPGKPNIANEVEEKKNGVEKETPKTPEPNKKQGGTRRRPVAPPPQRPAPLDVTFTTDVPESEIFLSTGGMNRQSLGKTGADGKLVSRLVPGRHNVTATHVGHRIQTQQIEVRPGNTTFAFKLSIPAPAEKSDAEKESAAASTSDTAATATASRDVSADKALTSADELIKRFLDARETENVTGAQWQQVLSDLNAALEREPDNSQLKGRALVAQGQLAYLKMDYASALIAFNKAVKETPDLAVAHYGRGNAYLATNQPVEAFKAYQRAVDTNSELGLAYKGMGDALTKQGRQKDANQYYARAKTSGDGPPASLDLISARSLKKQKRWAQALKQFQDLATAQPTADTFVDIGDCYMGLEQPLSASQAYRRAAELDPKSALAHYKYGEVMFNLREYGAAAEALELSLALDLTGASVNRKRAREMANKAAEKLRKMD